jgi:hypothetical protein
MPNGNGHDVGLTWLLFAVLALSMWGTYGVWLHAGASAMNTGNDPNFRYKAYIFVGLAYFFVAILCPVVVMLLKGANWTFPARGVWLSLGAGCVGALGAFFVLSAMGSVSKQPWMIPVVMAVVFAGAPIVNAIVALIVHPPEVGWSGISPLFWVGIIVAATGATMVTVYKPKPGEGKSPDKPAAEVTEHSPSEQAPVETGDAPTR